MLSIQDNEIEEIPNFNSRLEVSLVYKMKQCFLKVKYKSSVSELHSHRPKDCFRSWNT